jgi:sugar/nucleoside kinase (ribokinase family)
MATLGIEVVAMGAIGQDEIGEFLVGVMQRYGIDTSHLNRKAGVQTSSTMLPIRPNGERPALHVIGANGELTWEDIDLEAVAQASFLHLGGTPLLLKLDGEPASRVLRHAREHGVTTTYDLLGIPDPKLAQMVEVCLPYVDYSGARIMNGTVLKGHRMLKTDPHSQSAGFTHKAGPAGTATGRPTGPGTAI